MSEDHEEEKKSKYDRVNKEFQLEYVGSKSLSGDQDRREEEEQERLLLANDRADKGKEADLNGIGHDISGNEFEVHIASLKITRTAAPPREPDPAFRQFLKRMNKMLDARQTIHDWLKYGSIIACVIVVLTLLLIIYYTTNKKYTETD